MSAYLDYTIVVVHRYHEDDPDQHADDRFSSCIQSCRLNAVSMMLIGAE